MTNIYRCRDCKLLVIDEERDNHVCKKYRTRKKDDILEDLIRKYG